MWDAWPPPRPLILSHRGLAPGHRENTVEGVEAAFGSGADAVEVDVRVTADGVPVLHHDRRLGGLRVANTRFDTLAARAVEEGYRLATLGRVLRAAAGEGPVTLEIKDPAAMGPALSTLASFEEPPVFVTGFDIGVLEQVHDRAPELPTGLILGALRGYRLLFSRARRRRLASWLERVDPDALVLHRRLLRLGVSEAALGGDRPVVVWTVNRDEDLARTMRHPFVWGVITDRPAGAHRARNLVRSLGARVRSRTGRTGIDSSSNRSRQPG